MSYNISTSDRGTVRQFTRRAAPTYVFVAILATLGMTIFGVAVDFYHGHDPLGTLDAWWWIIAGLQVGVASWLSAVALVGAPGADIFDAYPTHQHRVLAYIVLVGAFPIGAYVTHQVLGILPTFWEGWSGSLFLAVMTMWLPALVYPAVSKRLKAA